ncbi:hypothetical protein [Sphingopyxis sp.]|uniref:hypothetical protein n=1 Tax=Sphingopyxis sp. TaxID=1908224 RepID=UPI002EDA5D8F
MKRSARRYNRAVSFPRKRESRVIRAGTGIVWIPAFAGMTSSMVGFALFLFSFGARFLAARLRFPAPQILSKRLGQPLRALILSLAHRLSQADRAERGKHALTNARAFAIGPLLFPKMEYAAVAQW